MGLIFSLRLAYLLVETLTRLLLAFTKRYQPFFLSLSIFLIVVFSLLLESLLPLLNSSPLPQTYDEPTSGYYSQSQIQQLYHQWKTLEEIQPRSVLVQQQVKILEEALNNKE